MRLSHACARALLAGLALGCASAPDGAPEHVAIESDFAQFRDWARREVAPGEAIYESPGAAPAPPFARGTILVKTDELGPAQAWRIHAMVKRGGAYASDGMRGWELFELYVDERDVPRVLWRGAHAPAGLGGYPIDGGLAESPPDCVTCHDDPARDYTLSF